MPARLRGIIPSLCNRTLSLPPPLRLALYNAKPHLSPRLSRPSRAFSTTLRTTYQRASSHLTSDPVLRRVIQTRTPILLYRSPPNRYSTIKTYLHAFAWIGAGAFSIKFANDIKDRGLTFFVRPTYIVVGVAFIGIGCYICSAPTNRMRLLEVVPGVGGGPMQLRMTVRAAPWLKEQVLHAQLGEASISEKTSPMVEELVEAARSRRQRVWDDLGDRGLLRKGWEGTARWVHQKWTNFFLRFKFAVLRFGIAKVEVRGSKWKLDCSGWLLEDGKAVDRIIPED